MRSRAIMLVVLVAGALSVSGCAHPLSPGLIPQQSRTPVAVIASTAPAPTTPAFDSLFTRDGSVSLSADAADELEVRLDVWASNPQRTGEWSPENEKSIGFAVNVYDGRVSEDAELVEKRRVYLSDLRITSSSVSATTTAQSAFEFSADAGSLVPAGTAASDRGVLLNNLQGGLLVPDTTILQLPPDTYGMTLSFALTLWVEGAADDDDSFTQRVIYHDVPIRIFPASSAVQSSVDTSD